MVAGGFAIALMVSAPAEARRVAIVLAPPSPVTSSFPEEFRSLARRGAVGLMVPGTGRVVSSRETLDELGVRSLPDGTFPVRIVVSIPPPGEHHNVTRYPIAILGDGYRGLLVSSRTRIPGLVSARDIPDTVRDLEDGRTPPVSWRADANAPQTLLRLEGRLARAHASRGIAMGILIGLLVGYGLLCLLLRSPLFGRAALLVGPAALLSSLALSGAGAGRPWVVGTLLGAATALGSLAAAALLRSRWALGSGLVAFLAAYLVVIAVWPVDNSLAAIGPHPDGGGRFYGVTNQVSTLLLTPAFLAAALLGLRLLVPVAALALLTVGASFSGADGGGAIVLLAGFLVLGLRLYGLRLTARNLVLVGAVTIAAGLAFVGIDAALGGSSHVTRAIGAGPGEIADDIGHRIRVSAGGAVSSWYAIAIMVVSLSALAWLATRRPRSAALDALLVALVVSLLVNDTPTDVAGFGALSGLVLWAWNRAREGRLAGVRRLAPILSGFVVLAAGCGGEQTVSPLPETVAGTTPTQPTVKGDPAAGKTVFVSQGCGSCHTFKAAGTNGTVGPDLDEAVQGKSPEFVRESIVNPNADVASGFAPNIMPSTYGSQLSNKQLADLVAFLTQK